MNKDKIALESALLILKSTIEVYVHGTLEASNKKVRDTLALGLQNTMKMQHDTYDKMTELGFYTVENIKPAEIDKTLKKLSAN